MLSVIFTSRLIKGWGQWKNESQWWWYTHMWHMHTLFAQCNRWIQSRLPPPLFSPSLQPTHQHARTGHINGLRSAIFSSECEYVAYSCRAWKVLLTKNMPMYIYKKKELLTNSPIKFPNWCVSLWLAAELLCYGINTRCIHSYWQFQRDIPSNNGNNTGFLPWKWHERALYY